MKFSISPILWQQIRDHRVHLRQQVLELLLILSRFRVESLFGSTSKLTPFDSISERMSCSLCGTFAFIENKPVRCVSEAEILSDLWTYAPIRVCTHSTPSEMTVSETTALSLPDFALLTDARNCDRYVGCDWLSMRS